MRFQDSDRPDLNRDYLPEARHNRHGSPEAGGPEGHGDFQL